MYDTGAGHKLDTANCCCKRLFHAVRGLQAARQNFSSYYCLFLKNQVAVLWSCGCLCCGVCSRTQLCVCCLCTCLIDCSPLRSDCPVVWCCAVPAFRGICARRSRTMPMTGWSLTSQLVTMAIAMTGRKCGMRQSDPLVSKKNYVFQLSFGVLFIFFSFSTLHVHFFDVLSLSLSLSLPPSFSLPLSVYQCSL